MTEVDDKLEATLSAYISTTGLEISTDKIQQLLAFVQQLHKWNKAFNLSGIKNIEDMLTLHILDSLVLAPYVDGKQIADVGTGAGLPGIPLAIVFPEKHFFLIDSNSKKTRFVFQTCAQLGISNVTAVHSRVEDYASIPQVDIVTSRAFASLSDFVLGCRHIVTPAGKFLAMKGQYPQAELDQLPPEFVATSVNILEVPGIQAERHVVDIRFNNQPFTG